MRRGIKSLQAASPTDGQTIHGRLRPAVCQVTPERLGNFSLASLLLSNPFAAMPAAHQSATLFHAMRLTSGVLALQSP